MDELGERGAPARSRAAGSMTRAMRAVPQSPVTARCLRVAVVRDGSIDGERICRSRDTITVGRHERAAVLVPDPSAPLRHSLFERLGDGYSLELTHGMRARVARADGVHHLEGPAVLMLDDASRGKVDVGGMSVLFQMVDPPPVAPRPRLPLAVRGGWLAGVDWLFSATVMTSFLLFFGFVLFLDGADWPVARIADVPDSHARLILEEPAPPPPDVSDTQRAEVDEAVPMDDQAHERDDASRPTHARRAPAPRPGPSRPSLADREEVRQAVLLSLGTLDGDGLGSALDRVRGGAPTTDAAGLLAEMDGVAPPSSDQTVFTPSDGCRGARCGSGRGDDLGSLVAGPGGDGPVDEGTPTEQPIDIVVIHDDPLPPPRRGRFDARLVTEQVRRRVRAIRACYEHTLGPSGDIEGRVTAELTVERAGNVSNVRAVGNSTGSPAVARCVTDSLRTIRLRQGPDFPMTFSYPFVFAARL